MRCSMALMLGMSEHEGRRWLLNICALRHVLVDARQRFIQNKLLLSRLFFINIKCNILLFDSRCMPCWRHCWRPRQEIARTSSFLPHFALVTFYQDKLYPWLFSVFCEKLCFISSFSIVFPFRNIGLCHSSVACKGASL